MLKLLIPYKSINIKSCAAQSVFGVSQEDQLDSNTNLSRFPHFSSPTGMCSSDDVKNKKEDSRTQEAKWKELVKKLGHLKRSKTTTVCC